MNEQFLRKEDLEDRFNCGWRKARSLLEKQGVKPVDFGGGAGGGLAWLASAVDAAMLAMHKQAQPGPKKRRLPKACSSLWEQDLRDVQNFLESVKCVQ